MIKRDDLSGHARGGAKTRKIAHLLAHVLARGHDRLFAVVGNISNLAFDLVPALDRCQLPARIFVVDDPPASRESRELIFAGIRDRVELLEGRCSVVGAVAGAYCKARSNGARPFLALPGFSHPSAVLGNACGFLEMVAQLEKAGQPLPAAVFVTAATGSTLAGFLLAEHALRCAGRPPIRIIGVRVYPGAVARRTLALLRWTERAFRATRPAATGHLEIVTPPGPVAFGGFGPALPSLCRRVREECAIDVDPIFGGKTWQAMELHTLGRDAGERPILFWHCGYTPEWELLASRMRTAEVPS